MTDGRHRQPAGDETPHAVPKDAAILATPRQRAIPEASHLEPKEKERRLVHGHSVIADVSTHHCLQPLAQFRDGFVHASQLPCTASSLQPSCMMRAFPLRCAGGVLLHTETVGCRLSVGRKVKTKNLV